MKIFDWMIKRKPPAPPTSGMGGCFCLSKDEANKLKMLDIEKIILLDGAVRLEIFSKLIGEEKAKWVNARFEKDLVLKNYKAGLLNWANKTDVKEKYKEEIIKKISALDKVLNTQEEEVFLNELSELALGISITKEESDNIFILCQNVEKAKVEMENGGSETEYERARKILDEYCEELKNI